jgi:hypothetical protein
MKTYNCKQAKSRNSGCIYDVRFFIVSAQQVSCRKQLNRHFRIRQKPKKQLYRSKKPNIRLMRQKQELYHRSAATAGLTYNPILQNLFLSLRGEKSEPSLDSRGTLPLLYSFNRQFLIREFYWSESSKIYKRILCA